MLKRSWLLSYVTGGVALFLLWACATSPTGRKQVRLFNEQQMTQLGSQSFEEIKKKMPQVTDPEVTQYIRCVAQRITQVVASSSPIKNWSVEIFKEESANAFALPGGYVGVHSGLLKVATSADQLAAVLGHEVGHVIARHGNERMSQMLLADVGLTAADFLLGENNPRRGQILAALGVGAQIGLILPYSRKQESEADELGIEYMAKAAFDPEASIQLWQNMKSATQGKVPPEFLSTHPSPNTRMAQLRKLLPKANGLYTRAVAQGSLPQCRLK